MAYIIASTGAAIVTAGSETYNSTGILALLEETLGLPATRSAPTPATLYGCLSRAQERMMALFAAHVPWTQYDAPELLITVDSGLTYTFAGYPLGHAEVRESRTGLVLRPVPEWSEVDGYVMEGQIIRWPNGRSRTFSDGPYARYVKTPGVISAADEPVLRPAHARQAIVFDAAREWATQGGNANPEPYKDDLKHFLWGDPETPGHVGFIPSEKTKHAGNAGGDSVHWWRYM